MEQAHGYGIQVRGAQPGDHILEVTFVQGRGDLARVQNALGHLEPEMAGNDGLGLLDAPVVEVRAVLASDLQYVPEAAGYDQGALRALALKKCVRSHSGAVAEEFDFGRRYIQPFDELVDSVCDAGGLILRSGGGLGELELVGIDVVERKIREGAANVDAQPVSHRGLPCSLPQYSRTSRASWAAAPMAWSPA